MAENLPTLANQERLIDIVEDNNITVYNFLDDTLLPSVKSIQKSLSSIEDVLRTSLALQERDSDYLKAFNQEQELRQEEALRETQQVPTESILPAVQQAEGTTAFFGGPGMLGRLLRGGLLAGVATLFADEIASITGSVIREFLQSAGFEQEFSESFGKAFGTGASGAVIGASIGSIIGRPIGGAIAGAAFAMSEDLAEAITDDVNRQDFGSNMFKIAGGVALFNPVVGAILAGVTALGIFVSDFIKEKFGITDEIQKNDSLGTGTGEFGDDMYDLSTPEPQAAAPATPLTTPLGTVTAQSESAGDVGAISTGAGDPGGKSYGLYQMTIPTMRDFMANEGNQNPSLVMNTRGTEIGSPEFDEGFRRAAENDPAGMRQAQQAYIERTHYQPALARAQAAGFSTENRLVQEAMFSVGVQHSPAGQMRILENASPEGSPQEQVRSIMRSRSNYIENISGLSPQTIENIQQRYERETQQIEQLSPVASTTSAANIVGSTEAARVGDKMVAMNFNPVTVDQSNKSINTVNQSRTVSVPNNPQFTEPSFMRLQDSQMLA